MLWLDRLLNRFHGLRSQHLVYQYNRGVRGNSAFYCLRHNGWNRLLSKFAAYYKG